MHVVAAQKDQREERGRWVLFWNDLSWATSKKSRLECKPFCQDFVKVRAHSEAVVPVSRDVHGIFLFSVAPGERSAF